MYCSLTESDKSVVYATLLQVQVAQKTFDCYFYGDCEMSLRKILAAGIQFQFMPYII